MYAFVYISDIIISCFNDVCTNSRVIVTLCFMYGCISVCCSTYNVGTPSEILELSVIIIMSVMTVEIQPLKAKVYSEGSTVFCLTCCLLKIW